MHRSMCAAKCVIANVATLSLTKPSNVVPDHRTTTHLFVQRQHRCMYHAPLSVLSLILHRYVLSLILHRYVLSCYTMYRAPLNVRR